MSVFAGRAVFPTTFADPHGNGRAGITIAVYRRLTYTDGVTVLGSKRLTSATAAFTSADEDKSISAENFPSGATIESYVSATEVDLSVEATAGGSGASFIIAGRQRSADLATVYTDRLKSATTSNPYVADVNGNTAPLVDPGDYDAVTVHGVTEFTVLPDHAEPLASAAVEEAMLAFNVATQTELDAVAAAKQDVIPPGTYAKPATSGTLAARPAATIVGQRYLATDTGGGTEYESLNGSTWTQLAAGVSEVTTEATARAAADALKADNPTPGTARTALAEGVAQTDTGIKSIERVPTRLSPTHIRNATFAVPINAIDDAAPGLTAAVAANGTRSIFWNGGVYDIYSELAITSERVTIFVDGDVRLRLRHADARLRISAFHVQVVGGQIIVDGMGVATNCVVVTKGARARLTMVHAQNALGDGVLVDPDGTGGGSCNHLAFVKCRSINNGGNGFAVADSVSSDSTSLLLDDCEGTDNALDGALIRNNLAIVRGGTYTSNDGFGISLGKTTDVNRTTTSATIQFPRLEDNVLGPFNEGKGDKAVIQLGDSYSEAAAYVVNPTGNNWRWHYSSAQGGFTLLSSNGKRWKFRNTDDVTEIPGRLGLAAGTVGAPAVYPNGDSDTGISFPAANQIAGTTGGTERWRLSASGHQWKTPTVDLLSTTAASGAALTVSALVANVHQVTLTANCTFTLAAAFNGSAMPLTIVLRQDATGGRTVTWPASVKWAGGAAPTLSAGANAVDIVELLTLDGGTTWFGHTLGIGFA